MACNQLTIINDLPKFCGNPSSSDTDFVPGIDVKTFIRSLDNHFTQYDITDDARKLQVLYALVEKNKGDAIDLVTCYSGKQMTYKEVVKELLLMYPCFTATEITHAAKTILESDITKPSIFRGMTTLEKQSQALVEAYLTKPAMEEIGLNADIKVTLEGESDSDDDDDEEEETENKQITVLSLLQNFCMHLVMAHQLPYKTYEKISKITPLTKPTLFMALTVEAAEKKKRHENLCNSKKRVKPEANSVIFNVNSQAGDRTRGEKETTPKPQRPTQRNRRTTESPHQTSYNGPRKCFRCGLENHLKKDCKVDAYCSFCKIRGHTIQVCRKKNAKGKYCQHCGIKDSHSTSECYVKRTSTGRNQAQRVQVINEGNFEDPDKEYNEEGTSESDEGQE